MKIAVIGCGRWGSFLAWYTDKIGHDVKLYGRASSQNMQRLIATRENEFLTLPEGVELVTDLSCLSDAEIIIVSLDSQGLRRLFEELTAAKLNNKSFVLCMKGIEISTGKRLSRVAEEFICGNGRVAVWMGPGHVQEFYAGIPNCMVIDSEDDAFKHDLVDSMSSELTSLLR